MTKKPQGLFHNLKSNSLGKSMFLSVLCKLIGMIVSFLYIPILLGYLGGESCGIWSSAILSSNLEKVKFSSKSFR